MADVAVAMSGSAVFSATIEAITTSTPKHATVSNHSRARCDKPARAKSPLRAGWVIASTTRYPLQRCSCLTPKVTRLTVSFLARIRVRSSTRPRTRLAEEQMREVIERARFGH